MTRCTANVNATLRLKNGYGDIRMTGEVQIELPSLPVDVDLQVLNALKAVRS